MRDDLPKNWKLKRFQELARVVTGSTPSTQREEFYGGRVPFVTPVDLDGELPVVKAKSSLTELGAAQVRMLPPNSVMVCCIGSLGKVGIAGTELATNQQINSLVFDENLVFPRFAYHYCRTLKSLLVHLAPSTTVAIVNKSRFQELTIPLPPLPEQKRIAAILDKADAIRRKRKESIALADTFLKSVFIDMFGDPVTNPGDLPVIPLGQLIDRERGISYGIVQRGPECRDGVPVIRISNIANNSFNGEVVVCTSAKIAAKYKRTVINGGELLLGIRGTVGNVAIAPPSAKGWNVSREIAVIPIKGNVNPHYVKQAMLSDGAQNFMYGNIKGVAQRGINLADVRKLPIPMPNSDVIIQFAKMVQSTTEIQAVFRKRSDGIDLLFNSLLHRAFRGEV